MKNEIDKSYINLYSKYRPNTFDELVGQEHVSKLLQLQIQEKTVPNCIIIYGAAGVGKTSLARLVATGLNSSEHGTIEKDAGSEGGKDSLRSLQTDIYNKPFVGEYKTYIFDECHRLSKAAFDSLLKITEEPPEHVKFIFLTTSFEDLPLTIKSRSQCHALHSIPGSVIKERLKSIVKKEKMDITPELINLIVDSSEGSLRNAIVFLNTVVQSYLAGNTEVSIAKTLGVLGTTKVAEFMFAYVSEDFSKIDEGIEMFFPDNTDSARAIGKLQQYAIDCRYALIFEDYKLKSKSDVEPFLSLVKEGLTKSGKKLDKPTISAIGGKLDQLYDLSIALECNLKRTTNKEAALRRFAITLAQSWAL